MQWWQDIRCKLGFCSIQNVLKCGRGVLLDDNDERLNWVLSGFFVVMRCSNCGMVRARWIRNLFLYEAYKSRVVKVLAP